MVVLNSSPTHRRGNAAGDTVVPTVASFRESQLGEKITRTLVHTHVGVLQSGMNSIESLVA
jgi:hypothetical protein